MGLIARPVVSSRTRTVADVSWAMKMGNVTSIELSARSSCAVSGIRSMRPVAIARNGIPVRSFRNGMQRAILAENAGNQLNLFERKAMGNSLKGLTSGRTIMESLIEFV